MNKIWQLILIVYNFFIRKRAVYRLTGGAASVFIFYELGIPKLPLNSKPDYDKIALEYGEFVKAITGFFIDKMASGTNYLNLAIAMAILAVCLLIEFNILKSNKTVTATNIFSGWFQVNKQINHYDKE